MGICPSPSSSSSTASFDSSTSTKEWIVHGIVAAAAAGTWAYMTRFNNFRPLLGVWKSLSLKSLASPCMIQRTRERVKLAAILDQVVATADENIAHCCRHFGTDVIMKSESCRNGTERCNEAKQKLGKIMILLSKFRVMNPLIEPEIVDSDVKTLRGAPDEVFSNVVSYHL